MLTVLRATPERLTLAVCFLMMSCTGAMPENPAAPATADAAVDLPDAGGVDASETGAPGPNNPNPNPDAGISPTTEPPCAQGAACTGNFRCASNDGAQYRSCSCSAGRLACFVAEPSAPTTCVEGAVCTGTDTCAVDTGSGAAMCKCVDGARACKSVLSTTRECPAMVSASTCFTSRPPGDPDEWIDCFKRGPSGAFAYVCRVHAGGVGSSGVTFRAECPAATPSAGAACNITSGPACACRSSNGAPCVCRCGFSGGLAQTWGCL